MDLYCIKIYKDEIHITIIAQGEVREWRYMGEKFLCPMQIKLGLIRIRCFLVKKLIVILLRATTNKITQKT